jgi:hypothetical protein
MIVQSRVSDEEYEVMSQSEAQPYLGLPGIITCTSEKAKKAFGPGSVLVPKTYLHDNEVNQEELDEWRMAHT